MTLQPVLVVWEHGGNLGHLARLIPVMRALCERGRAVVFSVAQPQAVAPLLSGTGVTIVQAPQVLLSLSFSTAATCPADIWLRCGFASPPHAMACVRLWLGLFERLQPTSVLVDASPVALYAAKFAGLPTVALGNGFELPPALTGLSYAPWQDGVVDGAADVVRHSERVLESALVGLASCLASEASPSSRGEAGLGQARSVGAILSFSRQALCIWPELDHFDRVEGGAGGASAADFVGPIWSDLPGARALAWPDKPGAKVLCYLALTDSHYDFMWHALQRQGANVLVVSPAGLDWVCESARSRGVTVYQQPAALAGLLPDCDAVIGHGGMGLTGRALHAGKPLMLLPTQLEQSLLAYKLVQRGLAISTLDLLNKAQVQARVTQLLQDMALRARAVRLSARYPGFTPDTAIDRVVTKLLGGSSLDSKNKMPERAECLPL